MSNIIHAYKSDDVALNPRRNNDFYPTENSWIWQFLLLNIVPDGPVWEPFCGEGGISKPMIQYGHDVISTDLYRYGFGRSGVDFYKTKKLRAPNIVSNPPFTKKVDGKRPQDMVTPAIVHALKLGAKFIALTVKAEFLSASSRDVLFESGKFSEIYIPNWRPDFTNQKNPHRDMIWIIFRRDHDGSPPKTYRLYKNINITGKERLCDMQ